MADIPEANNTGDSMQDGSYFPDDELRVDFNDPLSESLDEHLTGSHINLAPLPSQAGLPRLPTDVMTSSGEDLADLAHVQPVSVLPMNGTTFTPPQISIDSPGLLTTDHLVPTIVLSPVWIPPCTTSSTIASSLLLAAIDPPSPASIPLSPKKATKR
ncbi:hypothetical protein J132_01243 [Termitomyces sp. J132]|nr:hypothetical protein J132_01243 [Termitomyces sp. J132]